MPTPSFRFIPLLGDPSKALLRLVRIDGLSTVHNDAHSDAGTLYVSITGTPTVVTCYADMDRTAAVLQGTAPAPGQAFALSQLNGSGLSGSAVLESYAAPDLDAVALVSLAGDADVALDLTDAQAMKGYDGTYGLAFLHAQAQRDVLCTHLPARVPHLYPGKVGINGYTPGQLSSRDIPDLRRIAGWGQLREAQAAYVKARSFQQAEHLEEAREVASEASKRFMALMDDIAKANVIETEEAIEEEANWGDTVTIGSSIRC